MERLNIFQMPPRAATQMLAGMNLAADGDHDCDYTASMRALELAFLAACAALFEATDGLEPELDGLSRLTARYASATTSGGTAGAAESSAKDFLDFEPVSSRQARV